MHKGDAIQNIYYIRNGSMEVLQSGMVVAILGKMFISRKILFVIQFQYYMHDIVNINPRRITTNLGKGDLVGCDINKHLLAQTAALTFPSGNAAQPYSMSGGHSNNHQRRPSIGAMPISEVVVKSNADIRALTYCDLKVQLNPKSPILLKINYIDYLNDLC